MGPTNSGKHHRHGLHFLALTDEKGKLIGISAARPGRAHDATAARRDHIVEHLKAAGLAALADLGFLGVDKPDDPDDLVIVTGYKAARPNSPRPTNRPTASSPPQVAGGRGRHSPSGQTPAAAGKSRPWGVPLPIRG
ncbi:transposase family protein [Nonomuraea sp. NPDC050153]|uniref:transposase family protein n=1 Tax=Nonomuraea sp. NPDC050153 TaxID=3364359 RepID=UPI0037AF7B02